MKKFILFSLAIALGASDTLFAADTMDTIDRILRKRSRSEAFSDDKIIKIEMRDSNDNVIVSLPIGMEVAKLSNVFAEELPALLEELEAQKYNEDAQNNPLIIEDVITKETLKLVIDLMGIYNEIKEENLESGEHKIIRELYNQIRIKNFSKDSLIKLLEATNYLDIDLLEKVLGLVVFDQYKWQWNQEPVRPNVSLYTKRQLLALRRAINPHSRGVPLTPKQLAEYRIIPESFKDINDLKSYLNHPIGKSFSHHSNKAMVRFVRDYIAQALTANSLPELPELIDQFQAQPLTPLHIALFIEYYLQTNAQGTIADQLTHASILSEVANKIRFFRANHNVDDLLDFGYMVSNEFRSILGPLCQIMEPLCQRPITKLTLSGNQLTSIPATLGNLTNLTTLDLYNNKLTSLPAKLGNLINLTTLLLSRNKLTSIPAELGNLTHLAWLNLSNNQLTSLPAALGNLTHLTGLNLWRNKLTEIPAALGNLTHLTELDLRNNQLTEIPAVLNRLGLFVIKDDHVVFAAE
jgi:Leucine-rich repeat (LRR) protein